MALTVRRPTFDLTGLPRWWVGGSRLGTWFGDAAHVFIPLGEQFFIDAVKTFRDHIEDPELAADVRAFVGQESVHARVHRSVWDRLRDHGVPIDRYARMIEGCQAAAAPLVPAELQLATTAALEHYTAAFGRAFLEEELDPVVGEEMAALLRWHGAEEIEHRSVVYDVLAAVDPDWRLRMAGLVLGTALLSAVPAVGVAVFAADDLRRGRLRPPRLPDPRLVVMTTRFLASVGRDVARYVDPGFHPGAEPEPGGYARWLAAAAA